MQAENNHSLFSRILSVKYRENTLQQYCTMTQTIKIRKGLDIRLAGVAAPTVDSLASSKVYALQPDQFVGMTPKVVVKEGETVKRGTPLFVNKHYPDVRFASPVSGTVTNVVRGERRKVLRVEIEADKEQQAERFDVPNLSSAGGEQICQLLLKAGLFGYLNQLPYAISATPDQMPKGIFVSALQDKPLAADFEMLLQGNEEAFQAGLTALSKIAPVHLGIGSKQSARALTDAKDVSLYIFDGPCPAGNVGVQINHISPINKGETVWTADGMTVIFIGRLILTGEVDLRTRIAVAGSEVEKPCYVDTVVGQPLADILHDRLNSDNHLRIINGNPLTGIIASMDGYLGAHSTEVTVIPEGDDRHEILGWALPRMKEFSVSRSYFSWLAPRKKGYRLDARIKGGERHMIMSGEYDRVFPMDIYGEYLIKAIIAEDIDKMEQLGIYEVSPEDFALCEFVDSSKLPLQQIVRNGLDMLRKENA